MMARYATYATYDALYITRHLGLGNENVTLPEIHVFAYLACLLAVYDGRPVSTWGYNFVATESTAPFTNEMLEATDALVSAGLLARDERLFSTTDGGAEELERWQRLQRFKARTRYLRGATGTAAALPINAVTEGLSNDPQISVANYLQSPRPLLDDAGLTALHSQFRALESALGKDVSDLMVPAIVWITYLLEVGIKGESREGLAK